MKTLVSLVLLAIATSAYAVEPYVSIAGSKLNHDETKYIVDEDSGALISVGIRTEGNLYLFGEAIGSSTPSGSGAAVGAGINLQGVRLSGGVGKSKEEAILKQNGESATSADDYSFKFVEVAIGRVYVRYSEYDVDHDFNNSGPLGGTIDSEFSDNREAIQLGYRLTF